MANKKSTKKVLDTSDNVYTKAENKKIKNLVTWAFVGPILAVVLSLGGYIYFDSVLTPDAVVIEEAVGVTLAEGMFMDADPAHKAMGSFVIKSDGMGGRFIQLSNDFMVANAPDPHVMVNGLIIAKNMFKGGQKFHVPNFVEEDIMDVRIYCKIAGIDLAHSTLMMMDEDIYDDEEIIVTPGTAKEMDDMN